MEGRGSSKVEPCACQKARECRHENGPFVVAVAGSPNSGKTTLFNALTGANAKVGNYPGITVDRRMGHMTLDGLGRVQVVDVPGTYSLNAASAEEQIAIDELLGRHGFPQPDVVIVTLDATTLDRNLYMLMQVMEFGLPVIAAVTMMDMAAKEMIELNLKRLAELFHVPFVGVVATRKQGLDELKKELQTLLPTVDDYEPRPWFWEPGEALQRDLALFDEPLAHRRHCMNTDLRRRAFGLWLLMSVREDNELFHIPPDARALSLRLQKEATEKGRDLDEEGVLPRYRFIDSILPEAVQRKKTQSHSGTEKLDAVLTHPVWGLLVFLAVMTLIFQALFSWSDPMIGVIEDGVGWLSDLVKAGFSEGFLRDLVTEGILAGVGGVVVFLPQILFLFFFIGILEASGYMARAAFLIDRLMNRIGLHGKAFVPLLSGFACAVPAVMAVRTIENRRDRLLTMMVVPLMSCSARLPVYTLIIAALFPAEQTVAFISVGTLMLLGTYLLSTVSTLIAASVLGRTILKGQRQPLLLELPAYRMPNFKNLGMDLWERAKVFLTTAGTIILVMTILLWLMLSFPKDVSFSKDYETLIAQSGDNEEAVAALEAQRDGEALRHSYAGRLGLFIEPLLKPLGFDWKIGIGLIGSFAAREVFVSTMGVVYGIGGDADEESQSLREKMAEAKHPDGKPVWTPLVGMSLMVFFLFAMQCMSTIAVVKRETKSWRWPAFMLAYMTVLAYVASLIVYQGGRLLGFE